MSKRIEFGTKQAADQFRADHEEWLCPIDDDRRLKTIALVSDAPDHVVEQAELEAMDSRGEQVRSETADLSAGERERISDLGGFDQRTTTKNWESAKGVFAREGLLDQWHDAMGSLTDYDDPSEGAEEYVRDYRENHRGGGGARDHGEEDLRTDRKAADAARQAQSGQCNHARDHCEHGDPDACEFLQEACGFDEDEVADILSEEPTAEEEITGEAAGALARAWNGYKAGIARFAAFLDDIEETKRNAEQAAAAINAIRADHGQDPLEFERLEELSDRLAAAGREAHDGQAHIEQQQDDGATNA